MPLRRLVSLCVMAGCLGSVALANPPAPATNAGSSPAAATSPPTAEAAKKMVCRTEKVTGSSLRTRKICSTPDSVSGSQDWIRDQQQRGAIGASAILNGGQ